MDTIVAFVLWVCAIVAVLAILLRALQQTRVDETRPLLGHRSLRILLSNGRFPVTIDVARQLHRAGHSVFVVDPMKYHICKFSNSVKKSYHVPAPHYHPSGYLDGVRKAIAEQNVDLIIPLHEEILYLADSNDDEILNRLFSPAFHQLVQLHSKWSFSQTLSRADLDHPKTILCHSKLDFNRIDLSDELAFKPEFGRATAGVHHHTPGNGVPQFIFDRIRSGTRYIAQEWVHGQAYCSYATARNGRLTAFAVYPVEETLDGSSCVYFKAVEHARIQQYCTALARYTRLTGQFALDFIEEPDSDSDGGPGRLVAIECNPRATSGVHLYSNGVALADALVGTATGTQDVALARPGTRRQVAPGMLMWDRGGDQPALQRWFKHMARLMGTFDVVFSWRDLAPTLTEPFFLTTYYEIARERNMTIAEMFQDDLVWEPSAEHWDKIKAIIDDDSTVPCL